jgi:DNA-binding transcriptional LysR family regulator
MNVELKHLRKFVVLAQAQSFTRAAELLHVAQSALSRQIAELEERVGVQLVHRETRPIRLTEAGRRIYEDAVAVLERTNQMLLAARRIGQAAARSLTIGFAPTAVYGGLSLVVRGFRQTWPEVSVRLLEMPSNDQADAVRKGFIDVGYCRRAGDQRGLVKVLLREERLFVAVPDNDAFANTDQPLSMKHLGTRPIVLYQSSTTPGLADDVLRMVRAHGADPFEVNRVNGLDSALALAEAGSGYCLIPASARHLAPDMHYRMVDEDIATSPIYMCYRLEDEPSYIEQLKEATRQMFRSAPAWLNPAHQKIHDF